MNREESRDIYELFRRKEPALPQRGTSNRDTADWIPTFDDALLVQSAVDRFKNNAFDLIVDGESYRARLKPNTETLGPPPSAPAKKRRSIHGQGRPTGDDHPNVGLLAGAPGLTTNADLWHVGLGSSCPSAGLIILKSPGPIPGE